MSGHAANWFACGGDAPGLRSFVRTYVCIASDWRNLLFSFAFQGFSQQLTTSNSA
jgi:hypothetical protein